MALGQSYLRLVTSTVGQPQALTWQPGLAHGERQRGSHIYTEKQKHQDASLGVPERDVDRVQ